MFPSPEDVTLKNGLCFAQTFDEVLLVSININYLASMKLTDEAASLKAK